MSEPKHGCPPPRDREQQPAHHHHHSIEELSLSYNGGKDCLVLLVLILACLPRHFEPPDFSTFPPPNATFTTNGLTSQIPTNTPAAPTPVRSPTPKPFPAALQSVYIVAPDPFAEVDAFVERSASAYHLDLCRYALPMRAALDAYLRDRPRLRAVFVGTRRTDPHGASLTHFDPTDGDWPAFVRVHPVIDWHYAEIWAVSDVLPAASQQYLLAWRNRLVRLWYLSSWLTFL